VGSNLVRAGMHCEGGKYEQYGCKSEKQFPRHKCPMLKRYHAGKFLKNQKESEHVCAKDRIGLRP
jgi:hypothetical protein